MEDMKSKVYIRIDDNGCILRCEGGYTMGNIKNTDEWILIDEGLGDRYNLCQSNYFDGGLYTDDGIPRYKWDGERAVERTEEEIEADRAEIPTPIPSTEDILLEIAADHEYRLSLMEMGVTESDL